MNFILGGTHGLGLEIAKFYQQNNEETFVTGRSYNPSEHGKGLVIDLANEADAQKLASYIEDKIEPGTINRFFWAAGYGYIGDFAEQEDPEKMANVNFGHAIPAVQKAWKKMVKSSSPSSFVIISSTSGFKARKDEAVYVGTKHAQVGFARSLGLESERLNSTARVALFMPGGMQTPFWEGAQPSKYDQFMDAAKVAQTICTSVAKQTDHFYEETIEQT